MATFYIKQDNTSPGIQTTLTDPTGAAVDLSGKTVTIRVKKLGSTSYAVNTAATIVTAASGTVSYTFSAAQVAVPGVYRVEWIVNEGISDEETYPNQSYDTLYIERKA